MTAAHLVWIHLEIYFSRIEATVAKVDWFSSATISFGDRAIVTDSTIVQASFEAAVGSNSTIACDLVTQAVAKPESLSIALSS